MWRQNIDAIKWLIELWLGAQTICEGLNIDVIKWLIEPWLGAQTICGGLNIDTINGWLNRGSVHLEYAEVQIDAIRWVAFSHQFHTQNSVY